MFFVKSVLSLSKNALPVGNLSIQKQIGISILSDEKIYYFHKEVVTRFWLFLFCRFLFTENTKWRNSKVFYRRSFRLDTLYRILGHQKRQYWDILKMHFYPGGQKSRNGTPLLKNHGWTKNWECTVFLCYRLEILGQDIPLRFRKAGRGWCGGALETHGAACHHGVILSKTKEFLKSPCFSRS